MSVSLRSQEALSQQLPPGFEGAICRTPLQAFTLPLQQCLEGIDEASVVAEDVFADAQNRNAAVGDPKIGQVRTRQDEGLFTNLERYACCIQIVARLLRIGRELVVPGNHG